MLAICSRSNLPLSLIVACTLLSITPPVLAGPQHEAAILEVKAAEAVCDENRLDDALEMLAAVAQRYPDEHEAIGWAKYRRAEIYVAGLRFSDAAREIKPAWDQCNNGSIASPDLLFWSGVLYAKCLHHLGAYRELAFVCHRTLLTWNPLETANPAMRENAGWLKLWRAEAETDQRNHLVARESAAEAYAIGREFENGSLASWARLLEGNAALKLGDRVTALSLLKDCADVYGPNMSPDYEGLAQLYLAQTEISLGDVAGGVARALRVYEENRAGEAVQTEMLVTVAADALAKSATGETLQCLALQQKGLGFVGLWTQNGDRAWSDLTRALGDSLIPTLAAVSESANGNAGAAVRLALAEALVETEQSEEPITDLGALVSAPVSERLEASRAALADRVAGNLPAPKTDTERILEAKGEPAVLEAFLAEVRERTGPAYLEWLQSHAEHLPRVTYLLELSQRYLRHEVLPRKEGDPEYQDLGNGKLVYYAPYRNADAAPLLEEALALSTRKDERLRAYIGLIIARGRLHEDIRPVLDAFLDEMVNASDRVYGLVEMADGLCGANVVSCSLPNQNPDIADALLQIAMDTNSGGPWRTATYIIRARMYGWQNRLEEAVAVLDEVVDLRPLNGEQQDWDVSESVILLGALYLRKGEYEAAEACFRYILDNPVSFATADRGEAYSRLAESLCQQGRDMEVIRLAAEPEVQQLDPVHQATIDLSHARTRLRRGELALASELADRLATSPYAHLSPLARRMQEEIESR